MLPSVVGITAIGQLATTCDNPIIIESFRYDRLAEAIVVMGECANIYVETHLINSPNFVELLHAEGRIERMIFGSNVPLSYIGAAMEPIRNAGILEEERRLIFSGNLCRILEIQDEMH
jgi:predicted TIM-barrel fold metal-dependent hydrolase